MKTINKINLINLKKENGFTMQDLVIALAIIVLIGGVIGSIYIAIYSIQIDTQIDALATLYAIQITEYIDKISYQEVTNEMDINLIKQSFNISQGFTVNIDVNNYEEDIDIIKKVKIQVKYNIKNEERKIVFNRLKIKEL